VGGERGGADVLALLRAEVERTLALLGRPTIAAVERSAIGQSPDA
jgi:isopentenyl diphosphate isomerase/L-lactate dehydrogenase-like FMN-dependent dehydrogenase